MPGTGDRSPEKTADRPERDPAGEGRAEHAAMRGEWRPGHGAEAREVERSKVVRKQFLPVGPLETRRRDRRLSRGLRRQPARLCRTLQPELWGSDRRPGLG